MTIEQLRNGLQQDLDDGITLCYWFGQEGLEIILDSLDKRTPKPVQKILYENGIREYRCICGREVSIHQRRCDNCGQNLDWICDE